MLDSGSSASLVQQNILTHAVDVARVVPQPQVQLLTASKEPVPVRDYIHAHLQIKHLALAHEFLVVDTLVAPVILGVDFLQNNALVLDFTSTPITVCSGKQSPPYVASTPRPLSQQTKDDETVIAAIADQNDLSGDALEECAVPQFNTNKIELPECPKTNLCTLVQENTDLFRTSPGSTTVAYHYIPTEGPPVRVGPGIFQPISKMKVRKQLDDMLAKGTIEESNSLWMAPCSCIRKKDIG